MRRRDFLRGVFAASAAAVSAAVGVKAGGLVEKPPPPFDTLLGLPVTWAKNPSTLADPGEIVLGDMEAYIGRERHELVPYTNVSAELLADAEDTAKGWSDFMHGYRRREQQDFVGGGFLVPPDVMEELLKWEATAPGEPKVRRVQVDLNAEGRPGIGDDPGWTNYDEAKRDFMEKWRRG